MKEVRVEDVSRVFGREYALHRVSLSFEAGTLTALLGGNGAGKTTLLNILATLEAPSHGEVFYDRNRWRAFARRGRRYVGWVSHAGLVYEDLTGRENLIFYARMYGLKEPAKLAQQWLERVGIAHAADRRVHAYSRGMLQRLSIARALMHDPALLLLDEPLTGLDRQGRKDVGELFAGLREQGKILVMSTHDLHALDGLCDRVAILKQGKLRHLGAATSGAQVLAAYEAYA